MDINVLTKLVSLSLPVMNSDRDHYLQLVYNDPSHPASYSGEEKLYRIIKSEGKFPITRKAIKTWLQKQETFTLHRQVQRHFPCSRVIVSGVGKQADADLMDMTQLSKYNDSLQWQLQVCACGDWYVLTLHMESPNQIENWCEYPLSSKINLWRRKDQYPKDGQGLRINL